MVFEAYEEKGTTYAIVPPIAKQLGICRRALYDWVRQAETDTGRRPGVSSPEQARLAELERENRELRRANAILKAASTFFAAELDRHEPG
jgi:transposase